MNKIHADDYEFVLFEDDDFLYTGAKGYAFDPVGIQSPNYMLTSPKKLSWYNKNHEQYKLYTIHEDQEHCFGGYFIDIINRNNQPYPEILFIQKNDGSGGRLL
jgi:hypothetical protein